MKKQHSYPILLLFLLIVLLHSCSDIFQKDISEEKITIYAPPNNMKTNHATQTFWWEELENASSYRLQIVTGDFSRVESIVLDSTVSGDKFTFTLHPDTFTWRVQGVNNTSESMFTTHTLIIDSTADLSNQQIVLLSPADGYVTNKSILSFSWDEHYAATDYRIEIRTPDWDGNLALSSEIISATTYTNTDSLPEGEYEWGIQGQNANSATIFSTRTFSIDQTPPSTPSLVSPANNAILGDSTIQFTWNTPADNGSAIKDSIIIASDSLFTIPVSEDYTSSKVYSDSLGVGTYFWKVRSLDAAGNKSNYSNYRKLTVQ